MSTEYAEDIEQVNERYLVAEDGCGAVLHITGGRLDDVEVWLNVGGDFIGLAIGGGRAVEIWLMDVRPSNSERGIKMRSSTLSEAMAQVRQWKELQQ